MKYAIPIFLIVAGIIVGCLNSTNNQRSAGNNTIDLHVLSNGQVNFDGKIVSAADLSKQMGTITNPQNTIVQLRVSKQAAMGTLIDIQQVLRGKGTLKINYRSI